MLCIDKEIFLIIRYKTCNIYCIMFEDYDFFGKKLEKVKLNSIRGLPRIMSSAKGGGGVSEIVTLLNKLM